MADPRVRIRFEAAESGESRVRSLLSVTMRAVDSEHSPDPDVSEAHLACGRIAGVAQAIAEVHRFGQAEGPYEKPWAAEYHREANEPDPESETVSSPDIEPRTPAFVHFDELAKLTTLEGVSRLEQTWSSCGGRSARTIAPKDSKKRSRKISSIEQTGVVGPKPAPKLGGRHGQRADSG